MRKLFTILFLFVFGATIAQNNPIFQKPKFTPFWVTNRGGQVTPPSGPTENISFVKMPFSAVDLECPFRGEEQWHGGNEVNIPNSGSQIARANLYKRSFYPLNSLMPTPSTFNFGTLIADLQDAINNRQRISIGLPITYFDGADGNYYVNITGGGLAAYPQWLHDSMQLESPKDWKTASNYWCMNWNSPAGLRALERLLTAVKNLLNQTYNGVRYGDIVNTMDIRFLGNYGEWHSVNIVTQMSQYPLGTRMTTAGQQRVIDIYCAILSEYQLQIMIATFDCHRLPDVIDNDQAIAFYALSKTYGNGKVLGWRKDSYGSDEDYLPDLLQNNFNTFGGMRFDTAIVRRYKYAPITGEPNSGTQMINLGRDVRIYHTSLVGNSNYGLTLGAGGLSVASQDTIRAASKIMGYRIAIDSGTISTGITKGTTFQVKLYWNNSGLAPFYLNWPVKFSLRNGSNVEVWSATSTMQIYFFQPSNTNSNTVIADNLTIPTSVSSGTYSLNLIIPDPVNYNNPFQLYNSTPSRQSDGRYTLKSNITL